jgi:hypothetical protein
MNTKSLPKFVGPQEMLAYKELLGLTSHEISQDCCHQLALVGSEAVF